MQCKLKTAKQPACSIMLIYEVISEKEALLFKPRYILRT